MNDQETVLDMLHARGGAMSRMVMNHVLYRDGIDYNIVLTQMEESGLIRFEESRPGLELGCYVLTDLGKAALTPLPG